MKVLFVYSQTDPKLNKNYNEIASQLENSGNRIIQFKLSAAKNSELAARDYQKLISQLKKIDFLVVEASNPANGIGFLVATALSEKKPVLALVEAKSNKTKEEFWDYAVKSKLLTFVEYNQKTLTSSINEYLDQVKKVIDTKFILIISPEIDSYLQWASENRRMHKAQVVRRAVEEVMREDKEYKKYSTSQRK